MKLVYKIFLLFVPPVFYPSNLKKIKKFILDIAFSQKDSPIVFEKAFFKRHAFYK
jgi:hypothetical protein